MRVYATTDRRAVEFEVLGLPSHIQNAIDLHESGCWLWKRSLSRDGYGWTSLNNKTHQAHRLVYKLLAGEIPDGLCLDHLCRVRHCVNPAHLEPVTPGENIRRSELTQAGMIECAKGHGPLSEIRTQRRCLVCLSEYNESRRESKMLYERDRRARIKAGTW